MKMERKMVFNALKYTEHVTKVSANAYQYSVLNEFFHFYLLRYKIREFDVRGAIESKQWDVAYWSSKDTLKIAIKIFLFCVGEQQYSDEEGYFLLLRLKHALENEEDKYKTIEYIFYSNAQTDEDMAKEIRLTQTIINDYLIPSEVWELWGGEKQFNFSSYLNSVIITKKAFQNIDKTLMERPTYPIELLEEMVAKSQRVNKGK